MKYNDDYDDYEADDNVSDHYGDEIDDSIKIDDDDRELDLNFEQTDFDGNSEDDTDYLKELDIDEHFEDGNNNIDIDDFDANDDLDDDHNKIEDYDDYDINDDLTQFDSNYSDDNDLSNDYEIEDDNSIDDQERLDDNLDNYGNYFEDENIDINIKRNFDSMIPDKDEYASEYLLDDLPDHVIFNNRGNVYGGYDSMLMALAYTSVRQEHIIDLLNSIKDARNVRNLTNNDLRHNAKKLRTPTIYKRNGLALVECPNCDAPPTMIQSQYCPICNVRFNLRDASIYDEDVNEIPKKKGHTKYYVSVIFLIVVFIYSLMH